MTNDSDTPVDELTGKRDERRLQQIARQALDDSVAELDEATLARLAQARQQAVAAGAAPGKKYALLAGGSVIAAAMLLAVFWQQQLSSEIDFDPQQFAAVVSDSEEAWDVDEDLLDDMEFYAWLAEQELKQLDQAHAG